MASTIVPPSNTNPYTGVSWHRGRNKWVAHIRVSGRMLHLGVFDAPEAAAEARDLAAIRYRGVSAKLNFPDRLEAYINGLDGDRETA